MEESEEDNQEIFLQNYEKVAIDHFNISEQTRKQYRQKTKFRPSIIIPLSDLSLRNET